MASPDGGTTQGPAAKRERRARTGLQITDERLLWALQNEALGLDSWQVPTTSRPKAKATSQTTDSSGRGSGEPSAKSRRKARPAGTVAATKSKPTLAQVKFRQAVVEAFERPAAQEVTGPPEPTGSIGKEDARPQSETSPSATQRPPKRLKAMLVSDMVAAATLSDRCAPLHAEKCAEKIRIVCHVDS
jgi:hypothetical protein